MRFINSESLSTAPRLQDLISQAPQMELPKGLLFVDPAFYDIEHVINVHMTSGGIPNQVDKAKARTEWSNLVRCFEALGAKVHILKGIPGATDMVFCANQCLPYVTPSGKLAIIKSKMRHSNRSAEVEPIAKFYESLGYIAQELPELPGGSFEGMGDALWVPGRRVLCGGFGPRTHRDFYPMIAELTGAPVVGFQLENPKFYHLDTCLAILDEETVLACRAGFSPSGWQALSGLFPKVIEIDESEADAPGFACNAHCFDQKSVVIERGNETSMRKLRALGFIPVEVETAEFIKSGGSVFCMKQLVF